MRVVPAGLVAAFAVLLSPLSASAQPYIEKTSPDAPRAGTVLLIHGGAWYGGINGVRSTDEHRSRYLAWGWGVWSIDYADGRDSIRDVKTAFDRLAARTKKPICASGQSAGGHLALLLADQRDFECVIGEGALVDLDPELYELSCWAFCPKPDRFSPIERGDEDERVLLGHAKQDPIQSIARVRRYEDGRNGVALRALDPGTAGPFWHGDVDPAQLDDYRDAERELLARAAR